VVSFRWFRSGGFVPVVSGFSTCLRCSVSKIPTFYHLDIFKAGTTGGGGGGGGGKWGL
jgi:hypothetical protein